MTPNTTGLWKNGSRWWMRVRSSTGLISPRSTGTKDAVLAARIRDMVETLRENRPQWDLLDAAAAGDVSLSALYIAFAAGKMNQLRETTVAVTNDPDIEPLVAKWASEHLAARPIGAKSRRDYYLQVRVLIPEGVPFPRSQFTEDYLKAALLSYSFSGSTKRRHVAAWRLFYRYARKRAPLLENPFDDADWLPKNNPSRSHWWDHETRLKVLDKIGNPEFREACALMLGSGMELGALLGLKGQVSFEDHTVVAPGTKNESRRNRTVFVDDWAWQIVGKRLHVNNGVVFPNVDTDGKNLREAFYEAQVAAGLIAEPQRSPETGKRLWKAVGAHTLHDSRHTYTVCRLLGLDGEPKQDLKFCSQQLGHANEQMVIQIYGKANIAERLRRNAA